MPPEDVLAAISRLNGHARAYGCGREAIYACKGFAAIIAAELGHLVARPIVATAKCLTCSGTGRFRHWEDNSHERCRRCKATGEVQLQFVESAIGSHRWHHPYINHRGGPGGMAILHVAWRVQSVDYEGDRCVLNLPDGIRQELIWHAPEGDWKPNLPKERLPLEEAVQLLNIVEAWVFEAPWRSHATGGNHWWIQESAIRAMANYHLDLGRVPGPCCICHEPREISIGLHLVPSGSRLEWSRPCCADCKKIITVKDWPRAQPDELLTPAIQAWLAHPARQRPLIPGDSEW